MQDRKRKHATLSRPRRSAEIAFVGPVAAVRRNLMALIPLLPAELKVGYVPAVPLTGTPWVNPQVTLLAAATGHAAGERAALIDCDLVFREGLAEGIPWVTVADPRAETASCPTDGEAPPIARVGTDGGHAAFPDGTPAFDPGNLQALADFLLRNLRVTLGKTPLHGLVLAGGRSTRMGTDKAALAYHGRPQALHAFDLLEPLCARRFLSCRPDQGTEPALAGLPQIHDAFLGLGPMGGILSAMQAHPEAAWLVSACDLPFLDAETLRLLVERRDPLRTATAFISPHDGFPEPLCAIYEPKAFARLLQFLAQGITCPRKALIHSSCLLLPAPDPAALSNANHPEEYREALAILNGLRTPESARPKLD